MLNLLDETIKAILNTNWSSSVSLPGFYFTIPDDDWQTTVMSDVTLRLNIYLYEMRENRDFRRSQWDVITMPDNTAQLSQPPVYLDCHYLISAWSPTEDTESTSPIEDEHKLLSEAMRILFGNPDVNPTALGITGGGVVFEQAHIYLTVSPPEPPRVLNDFWTTMKLPWRPAIQLIATAPLDLLQNVSLGPLVTTMIQRFVSLNATGTMDERITIGGWVLNNADSSPIVGATVQRTDTGATVTTDSQGRYTVSGLQAGAYPFIVSAAGHTAISRTLTVPDPSPTPPPDYIFKLS